MLRLVLPALLVVGEGGAFVGPTARRDRWIMQGQAEDLWGDELAASLLQDLGFDIVSTDELPRITWAQSTADFFWKQNDHPGLVANSQDWPIFHLSRFLSPADLDEVQVLCAKAEQAAEDVEQFEPDGTLIRRSQVVNLSPGPGSANESPAVATHRARMWNDQDSTTIRHKVLAALPEELIGGEDARRQHPFEDASLVFYSSGGSFYDSHHDSWFHGDPMDIAHRAFTLLLYLKSPEDSAGNTDGERLPDGRETGASGGGSDRSNGGTRFPELLVRGEPLTLRLRAGDALLWPNFQCDGSYSTAPTHCALPLVSAAPAPAPTSKQPQVEQMPGAGSLQLQSEKVVLNMWFLGRPATAHSA